MHYPTIKSKMHAKLFSIVFNFNVVSSASSNDVIADCLPINPPTITLNLFGKFKFERRAEVQKGIKFL